MGDTNDMEYLREIAASGAWLGLDHFGIEHFNLADRIHALLALLDECGDNVHLSHDASCFVDFFTGNPAFASEKPSYLLVTRTVVPELLAAGATQADIDQMMIENPRRFLRQEA